MLCSAAQHSYSNVSVDSVVQVAKTASSAVDCIAVGTNRKILTKIQTTNKPISTISPVQYHDQ